MLVLLYHLNCLGISTFLELKDIELQNPYAENRNEELESLIQQILPFEI